MLTTVISGGQNGSDQAGIKAARLCGLATGGTAPLGYRTLDGEALWLKEYGLVEHTSPAYPPRTFDNAKNSDGTLRIARTFQSPGEKLTLKAVAAYGKPHFDVDAKDPPKPEAVAEWIIANNIGTLNVAGNSEKSAPGIGEGAIRYLVRVFTIVKQCQADIKPV